MSYIQKKFKQMLKKNKTCDLGEYLFFFLIYFWLHWVFIAEHILVATSGGCSLVVVLGLTAAASLVEEHGLWSMGFVVMARGLCCSKACGIVPDQGTNP